MEYVDGRAIVSTVIISMVMVSRLTAVLSTGVPCSEVPSVKS